MSFARAVLLFAALHVAWNLTAVLTSWLGFDPPEWHWLDGLVWAGLACATGYVAAARGFRTFGAAAAILAGLLAVATLSILGWITLTAVQMGEPAESRIAIPLHSPTLVSTSLYVLVAGVLGYAGAWMRQNGRRRLIGDDKSADAT